MHFFLYELSTFVDRDSAFVLTLKEYLIQFKPKTLLSSFPLLTIHCLYNCIFGAQTRVALIPIANNYISRFTAFFFLQEILMTNEQLFGHEDLFFT